MRIDALHVPYALKLIQMKQENLLSLLIGVLMSPVCNMNGDARDVKIL
jgi:hypothetical protein